MNSARGWHNLFFVKDLLILRSRSGASSENVSRPITDLQTGQISIGIYCRKKNDDPFFFWASRFQVLQGMFVQSFARKIEELRRTNIKSNLTPKLEYVLKPSNYRANPWFLHLTAQKSKCPRRFWELDPAILHTYLMCPCRGFYECVFLLFFRRKCGVS